MQRWSIYEAIGLIQALNERLLTVGYSVGLTGSVLFSGQSDNDLDLILYPLKSLGTPYQPAVEFVMNQLALHKRSSIEKLVVFDRADQKLVFGVITNSGHRVDIMIPHKTATTRADTLTAEFDYGHILSCPETNT